MASGLHHSSRIPRQRYSQDARQLCCGVRGGECGTCGSEVGGIGEGVSSHDNRRGRRTRDDYERGLPGYHDPTAGFAGSSPARSALTLRAVLASFGLVFCAAGAIFLIMSGLTALGVALAVFGAIALVDLSWVIHRKRRGEPD